MRHRIAGAAATGLGNPSTAFMDGKSTGSKERDGLINKCAKEAYELFFKGTKLDYDLCDAQDGMDEVRVGIEPAYQFEKLKMVSIARVKNMSSITTGIAYGAWGSGIRSSRKYYKDCKTNSKFKRFIDAWHAKLYEARQESISTV